VAVIAVIVAMEAELVHLRRLASSVSALSMAHRPIYELAIGGHDVIGVRSGIGMLNAASTTERAVAELAPEIVLNYGCAGAHHREIMPGDIVIGTTMVYPTSMNVLRDGTEVHNARGHEVSGERIWPAEIDADPVLLEKVQTIASDFPFEPWPADLFWPASVPRRDPKVHVGPIASSEIWTQQLERLDILHGRHGTLSEDMESAAVAHVALLHGIPYLSIKDISNNEYHAASDLAGFADFPTAEVGKRAAALVAALITTL
jgi:adenosylhomocysteine nucleosidase